MPFIGTQPEVGGYSVLDALTASATASYTLQKDSVNFIPNTANQLLVSLNGVIQKPGSSFTVSGSTLTFSSALASSDSIDFIIAMGEPLLVGTPSDGTVNTSQLATNAVSTAKIASSAVTDAKIADMVATKLTGTLAEARFPVGSVVQFQHTTLAGGSATSTATAYTDTGNQVTITPKFSNSKIFGIFSHVMRIGHGTSHTRADLRVLVTGDVSDEAYLSNYVGEESQDSGKDPINNYGGSFTYTVASTAAKTFKLQFRKAAAAANEAGNIYYKWYTGTTHTFTVMEIKQ